MRVFGNKFEVFDIKRFVEKNQYVLRYSGSGRPRTMRIPDNTSTVKDIYLSQDSDSTRASPREKESTTGISWSSVRRKATNDIGLRVFKRNRVQVLQPTTN